MSGRSPRRRGPSRGRSISGEPPRLRPSALENAALFYLQRFAASAESLRRVLLRRVERLARLAGDDADDIRAQGAALVDDLIGRFRRGGLLDDAVFAEGRSRSLHRRGKPLRAIAQGLAQKGVDAETIGETLRRLAEEVPDADHAAALALARRRRLGPFRPPEQRADHRLRDLAVLGRAGFSAEIARRVVDADEA